MSLYQALSWAYEPEMDIKRIKQIMEDVRQWLVPFLGKIRESGVIPSDAVLHGHFPINQQKQLAEVVLRTIGYDYQRGNFAVTLHPFMAPVGTNDSRVTTRFNPSFLSSSFFGVMHEGGHASFEQGVDELIGGIRVMEMKCSMGIHESQSRLWENLVGRSKPFWEFFYPILRAIFPEYWSVSLDDFYQAINVVKPGAIRVEADEVTYNLHILLRFELELALLTGDLKINDLSVAFAEKMTEYLGYTPVNVAEGVLQDIHWAAGYVGYFPTYLLGNLATAQLFVQFAKENPRWDDAFHLGNFKCLLDWMRQRVHPFGHVKELDKLIVEVTGEQLNPEYWFEYLKEKFGRLYKLN